MAARRANGVWVNDSGELATIVANADGTAVGGGVYNETPPDFDDGDRADFQVDATGNLKTAEGAVEVGSFFGALAAVAVVAKASAGHLLAVYGDNRNAGTRYLQVHNTAATPADQAVPELSFRFAAGTAREIPDTFFGRGGFPCDTGITLAWSSTAGTYTAGTGSEHDTCGRYA